MQIFICILSNPQLFDFLANAPLLESIERLHVESAAKEEAYDATIREKDVTIREMQKKEGCH